LFILDAGLSHFNSSSFQQEDSPPRGRAVPDPPERNDPTPSNPQADSMEDEVQEDLEHIIRTNDVSRLLSEQEQGRASTFKQGLDLATTRVHRLQQSFEKRQTAKKNQLEGKRGDGIDPCPYIFPPGHFPDEQFVPEDSPLHQEDLSSKCVGEVSQVIDELEEAIQHDFSTFYDHHDDGSIDADL
jgi:hypothetical protein